MAIPNTYIVGVYHAWSGHTHVIFLWIPRLFNHVDSLKVLARNVGVCSIWLTLWRLGP